jgi:protocatechuate 3,4-dioxygenase beta subunit
MDSKDIGHARLARVSKNPPRSLAKWIVLSVVAATVMLSVSHGLLTSGDRLSDKDSSVECADCSESTDARTEFGTTRGDSSAPGRAGSLGDRIFTMIRQIFTAPNASLRQLTRDESLTDQDMDIYCEQVRPDGLDCGGNNTGGYGRRLAGRLSRPAATEQFMISGHVMDTAGLGIGGVPVTVVAIGFDASQAQGEGAARRPITTTDESGFYEFPGLSEGDYEIRTAATDTYGPRRIAVRAGLTNADIVLVGERTLVIEGEVVGVAGERLEGVTVLPVLVGVPSVRTDLSGDYRLQVPLQPDTRAFTVRFQLAGFQDLTVPVDLTGREGRGSLALDVKMRPVESWTSVAGVVTDSDGSPLAGRLVSLRQVGGQQSYRTMTDRRGRYSFDAVEAPVPYYLNVSGAPDHEDYRKRIDVTTHATRFDVAVEPFEFGTVSGRLINADGAPVSNFSLVVRHKASSSPNAIVSSDAAGNFRVMHAPAGELTVASQSSPSILVRGLRLEPGDELNVPLVIDWGDHELNGVIVDHNNNPVPAARVLLTWTRVADGITTTTTRRARSDAQGNFYFGDLGPGPHLLQIDSPGRRPVKVTHDISLEGYFVRVGV